MFARKKCNKQANAFHCRECEFCETETKFETLSLKGEPTLGRCPYYKGKKFCVLLRQKACNKFKLKHG
nr:MAG TPA: hypothetical protein [Caudoviricetes sp.]